MSKISKTAAAAMKAGQGVQTKVDHFGTNEKKIKELRNQRRDGLAVNRFDFIDALLEEYDKVQLLLAQEIANVVVAHKELETVRAVGQALLKETEQLNGDLNKELAAAAHLGASTAALLARAETAEAQNKTDLFVLQEVSAARDAVAIELVSLKNEFQAVLQLQLLVAENRENSTEVNSEGTSQS